MRNEKEMLGLILGFAQSDERVRAVTLEGSRTNPNVPKDLLQKYDVSFHVTDTKTFILQPEWINVFGERGIMQTPDAIYGWEPRGFDFNPAGW